MYYPKADYLEKVKAITSSLLNQIKVDLSYLHSRNELIGIFLEYAAEHCVIENK